MKQIQSFLFALFMLFCADGYSQIAGNQINGNSDYRNTDSNQAFHSKRFSV